MNQELYMIIVLIIKNLPNLLVYIVCTFTRANITSKNRLHHNGYKSNQIDL